MGFLNPLYLFGLVLAGVPIIIHLLHRRRLKRVNFSSLFFLRDLKRERFSWLRLRELLLLAARTLLLFFFISALARPFLRSRILFGKHKASVAIILDDSYSMAYRHNQSSFERAQIEARSLVGQLAAGSEVILVRASQPDSGLVPERNLKAIAAEIDSVRVSSRAPDLKAAVDRAFAALETASLGAREIFVFTDLQRSSMLPLVTAPLRKEIPVYLVDVGAESADNTGIAGVELQNPLPSPEEPTRIMVRVKNYSDQERTKRITLNVNNEILERMEKLRPKEERRVVFDKTLAGPGSYSGFAELDRDSLAADDRRFFAFRIPEMIPVLLVFENPNDLIYLKTALAPTPSSIFKVETCELANLNRVELGRFKALALINPVHLTVSGWQRLGRYLDQGGGVFIDLGDKIVDGSWLAPFGKYLAAYSPAGFLSLNAIDYSHPIFEVLRSNLDPSLPKFFRIARVEPTNSSVVARFSDGSPFLLEAKNQRLIVATTIFNLEYTDLPLKTMFVPFVHRTFVYLAQGLVKSSYSVGDTIALPAEQSTPWTVVTPEQTLRILPTLRGERRVVEFDQTEVPGLYRLGDNLFGVNVRAEEGDLTKGSEPEIRRAGLKLLSSVRVHTVDLTQSLLYLALFFLIAEMVLLLVPNLPGWSWVSRSTRLGRRNQ
jgi:hypothetical protein